MAESVEARNERERVGERSEVCWSEGSNRGGGKFALIISLIYPSFGFQDFSSWYRLKFSMLNQKFSSWKCVQPSACGELNFSSYKPSFLDALKQLGQGD